MLSLSRHVRPQGCIQRAARTGAGFTLVEIVIALAVLGTMAAGVYLGFNGINNYAVSARLYSEALTAAQNEIDMVLSKAPFDVSAAYVSGSFNPALSKVPAQLMLPSELDSLATSGVSFPTAAPTATPATTSSYYPYYPYYRTAAGQPLQKQAFIYQDPVTGNILVKGTLTLTVTDPALTMSYINSTNLNTRRATVTVSYTFRNTNYAVSLDSMRTADQ